MKRPRGSSCRKLASWLAGCVLGASVLLAAGCEPSSSMSAAPPGGGRTLRDRLGREVPIEPLPARVVSLAPSTSEALYALGAVYIALVGRGIRWLERRLPELEAALAATAQPPVPPEENAAPLWREAFAAMRGWGVPEDLPGGEEEDLSRHVTRPEDPLDLRPGGTRQGEEAVVPLVPGAKVFAEDGPLARHVERNREAIGAALRAAARQGCDWGESPLEALDELLAPERQRDDEEQGGAGEDPPPSLLMQTRDLAMVLARALVLEAARGRWEECATRWRSIGALAQHTADGFSLLDFFVGEALGALGDRALLQAISSAPGAPPAALLASLDAETRLRLGRLPRASRALRDSQAHSQLLLARVFSQRTLPVDPRAWNGAQEIEISPLLLPMAAASELNIRAHDALFGELVREALDFEERAVPPSPPGRDLRDLLEVRGPTLALIPVVSLAAGPQEGVLRQHADEVGRARSMHVALSALARRLERGSWPARIEDAIDNVALARDPWLPDGLLSYEVEGGALAVGTIGAKGKFRSPARQPTKALNEEALRRAVLVVPPAAWWEAGR